MTGVNCIGQKTLPKPDRYVELEVFDNNDSLIKDASIEISGYQGNFDPSKDKYVLRYKNDNSYHVKITHPDYMDVDLEGIHGFEKKFYLLKENEPYWFYLGLKVPVKDYSELLYVTRKLGKTAEEDSVLQIQFENLISRIGLDIHFSMDTFVGRNEPPFHPSPGHVLKNSYVLKSKSKELHYDGEICVELEVLRKADSLIMYSGPLISNRDDFSDAKCPSGEASVLLKKGVEAALFEKKLISLGMKNIRGTYNYGQAYLYFRTPAYSLSRLNDLTEELNNMSDVESVGIMLNAHIENSGGQE